MTRTHAILFASTLLSACAQTAPNQTTAAESSAVCERETPTGSNIPVTRCRDADRRESERRDAEDTIQRVRTYKRPPGN